MRQRTDRLIQNDPAMVNNFLELGSSRSASVSREISLAAHISGLQRGPEGGYNSSKPDSFWVAPSTPGAVLPTAPVLVTRKVTMRQERINFLGLQLNISEKSGTIAGAVALRAILFYAWNAVENSE